MVDRRKNIALEKMTDGRLSRAADYGRWHPACVLSPCLEPTWMPVTCGTDSTALFSRNVKYWVGAGRRYLDLEIIKTH